MTNRPKEQTNSLVEEDTAAKKKRENWLVRGRNYEAAYIKYVFTAIDIKMAIIINMLVNSIPILKSILKVGVSFTYFVTLSVVKVWDPLT